MKALYISDIPISVPGEGAQYSFVIEDTIGDGSSTLKFLQTLVEGFVECVSLGKSTDMWVNEEGLFRSDFELNRRASMVAGHGYAIKGPAVITGQRNGNTISLTGDLIDDQLALSNGKTYTVEQMSQMVNNDRSLRLSLLDM